MAPLFHLLLPALLALAAVSSRRGWRWSPSAASGVIAALAAAAAGAALWSSAQGASVVFSHPWVAPLGVDFALRLDPFRSLFLGLVWGTTVPVILYSGLAFRDDPRLAGLLATLLLFAACMIGLILADDLVLFFLFWEGTSVLSFLLIGWNHAGAEARRKASQALLVTGLGGLALLAGLVLLRFATGAGSLGAAFGTDLSAHPLSTAIIVLIAAGAFAKSAQVPFHFWLPNAMAGPTPVSAFLHSATMVKAGVFLLALAAPALGAHPLWTPLLVTCGMLTVAAAVRRAWNETDLKAVLAATTLAALGHLTILAGIGTPAALKAFVVFLLAHALYKAPMFLSSGALEKAYGSRDLRRLRGAVFCLPIVGTAMVVSMASLLGLFPLPGFVGKEYFLKAAWAQSPALAIAAALSLAAVIALALRGLAPLLARGDLNLPAKSPGTALQLLPWISAAAALALTASFPWLSQSVLTPAAAAVGGTTGASVELWPGWGPSLVLSLAALLIGGVVAFHAARPAARPPASVGDTTYQTLLDALGRGSRQLASALQDRPLATHLGLVLGAAGLLIAPPLLAGPLPLPDLRVDAADTVPAVLALLTALSAAGAATARSRVALLVSLGLTGLLIALLYAYFSAPDLALTQLLTETILLVLMVAVLRWLPKPHGTPRRGSPLAAAGALSAGAVVTMLVIKAKALEFTPPVSQFFAERSLPDAHGANIVNVILVDFRALDTFGEITVLAVAAIGAAALLRKRRRPAVFDPTRSTLLSTALRLLLPPLFLFAAFLLLRGHNHPGGGFIAALVAATAAAFIHLSGRPAPSSRLDSALLVTGLSLAALSGLFAVAAGRPFLTGLWIKPDLPGDGPPLHLGTPLLFDLGVFLTVLGFALAFLRRLLPTTPSPVPSWN